MLGRGLADLIPVGGDAVKSASVGSAGGASIDPIQELPISVLKANKDQPRTHFDAVALEELASSVRQNGVLQPILVRPQGFGRYQIVAGERRYRAALKAGLTTIPVVIRELTDSETLALGLVENLLREDISPLETARAFRRLIDEFGLTQEELATRVGKSRTAVTNSLRLLDLPAPLLESLEKGEMTEGHARALLAKDASADLQRSVWDRIITHGISVREVERLMRGGSGEPLSSGSSKSSSEQKTPRSFDNDSAANAEMEALAERLRRLFGTRVRISGTQHQGQVEIAYFSSEQFDGLLARLEGRPEVEEGS